MSNDVNPSSGAQVLNAVKFIADTTLMPGSSQLVEGRVGAGLAYGLAGVAAKVIAGATAGPWIFLAVGVDSYSKSASGKHLWELFGGVKDTAIEVTKKIAEPAKG